MVPPVYEERRRARHRPNSSGKTHTVVRSRLSLQCLAMCIALAILTPGGCGVSRNFAPPDGPIGSRFVPAVSATTPSPVDSVLVISGGGAKGAFAAGLLNRWTQAGNRPKFTVVTGVSTGSLAAPFAFLGSEYDQNLARVYTAIDRSGIYRLQVVAGLFGADALATNEPLREQIEIELPPHLIARIAEEHHTGRRLYVATTDMDSKQQVVWDMGAIAVCGGPESVKLFHDVLLASAAIPIAFPPVPIDVNIDGQWKSELHTDGGVATNLLLPPNVLGIQPYAQRSSTSEQHTDVFVIVNGQIEQRRKPVQPRLFSILTEGFSGAMALRDSYDLTEVFLICELASANFHYVSIPDTLPEDAFDHSYTKENRQKIYAIGENVAASGQWQRYPPSLLPKNSLPPRAGVYLKTSEFGRY